MRRKHGLDTIIPGINISYSIPGILFFYVGREYDTVAHTDVEV